MSEKTSQIRIRTTEAQTAHVEDAQRLGGFKTKSDYARSLLFDSHVILVDEVGPLVVIPAFSSDPEAHARFLELATRVETFLAERQRFLTEGREVLEGEDDVDVVDPDFAELAQEPSQGEPVSPMPSLEAPAPAQLPAALPVSPQTAPAESSGEEFFFEGAVSELAGPQPPSTVPFTPSAAPVGAPAPTVTENEAAFLNRRVADLRRAGQSPMLAQQLAEAEWRQSLASPVIAPPVAPPTEPPPPPGYQSMPSERPRPDRSLIGAPAHGFCGGCGAPLAGTPFCSACGSQVA